MEANKQTIVDPNAGPTPKLISFDYKKCADMAKKNALADKWMSSTNLPMIKYTTNMRELEDMYAAFMDVQHDQRHRSDEESIRIYGYDNDHRYEMMKREINNMNSKQQNWWKHNVEIIEPNDYYYPKNEAAVEDADELAKAWSIDTNLPMLTYADTRYEARFTDVYNQYISTPKANRKKIDQKSIELYGEDIPTRYNRARSEMNYCIDRDDYYDKHSEEDELDDIKSDTPLQESTINSIYKVYESMQGMDYGYPDKSGKNIARTDPDKFDDDNWFYNYWKLLSPSQLKKYRCGICYDFVEYERELLEKAGLHPQSFYLGYLPEAKVDGPTHTFILVEDNKKWVWLEYSWREYEGVHICNSFEDALSDVVVRFIKNDASKLQKIFCKPYPKPKYGISMKEFQKFVMDADMPTDTSTVQELCNCLYEATSDIEKANILYKLNIIRDPRYFNMSETCYLDKVISDAILEKTSTDLSRKLEDTPYFTPDQLLDLGVFAGDKNYYSSNPDNTTLDDGVTTNQWFTNYIQQFDGLVYENYTVKWMQKLRSLYRDFDSIKESGDIDKINARKQSILELGWNPEIEFSEQNRIFATQKINAVLEMNSNKYDHVDLTYTNDDPIGVYIDKAIDDGDVSPVYIILDKGRKIYSGLIGAFTGSEYTHASIGFDADMSQNYTYLANGFSNETIESYADDDITVYAFFVKNNIKDKLKNSVNDFKNNTKKSYYDFRKFFDYILDRTRDTASQYAQVCSTFVHNILKSADINITKASRGIVSPKDIDDSMKSNKGKIYKVYDGPAKKYNQRVVKNKLARVKQSGKIKVLKEQEVNILESNLVLDFIHDEDVYNLRENSEALNANNKVIYETFIKPSTELVVLEAKLFPAQFDNEGNLLIYKNKLKKLDYAQEFEESNKLIQLYKKTNNIEGMKYECCKLWFMNTSIEKLLNKNHNKDIARKELTDCRARILNVFYSTMETVMQTEKNWNFVEFYNKTPFSDASIKVNNTTIKYTFATLKSLIK